MNISIPGIDISLRLKFYYRANFTPTFISERITPKNRVNLRDELLTQGFDYHHPFLLALDSNKEYSGDKLTLKSDNFFETKVPKYIEINDLYKKIPLVIKNIAARRQFNLDGVEINDDNRSTYLSIYLKLYENVSSFYKEKSKSHIERKKQNISKELLKEIRSQLVNGIISLEDALSRSGLGSKTSYYRRLKEFDIK